MIPMPPQPQWSDAAAFIAALVCAVVGILALLWGRKLSRWLLALTVAAIAFVGSGPLAARLNVDPLITHIAAALVGGVVTALLARMVWAMLAAALGGALAVWALMWWGLPTVPAEAQPVFRETAETFPVWLLGVAEFCRDGLTAIVRANLPLVLGAIVPAMLTPLVLLVIRPKLARLVMTPLLGAAALLAGPIIAMLQLRPDSWAGLWGYGYLVLAPLAALWTFGFVRQLRAAPATKAGEDEEEDESSPPPKSEKSKGK